MRLRVVDDAASPVRTDTGQIQSDKMRLYHIHQGWNTIIYGHAHAQDISNKQPLETVS